jgi:hypothetical protein
LPSFLVAPIAKIEPSAFKLTDEPDESFIASPSISAPV